MRGLLLHKIKFILEKQKDANTRMVLNVFCTTIHGEMKMTITLVKVHSLVSITPGFGALYFT